MKYLNFVLPIVRYAKPSSIHKPIVQMKSLIRSYANSTDANLKQVASVDIKQGTLRYLLIMVYMHGETKNGRTVVRGWGTDSHDDIYFKNVKAMDELGLCTKCLGGGRIDNDEAAKKIKIYGSCKTFGAADHNKTRDILLSSPKYKNFNITVKKD